MISVLSHLAVVALAACGVQALPSPAPDAFAAHAEFPRAGVSTLSSSALAALAPYTQFARAAYCPSDIVNGWECGRAFVCLT